MGKGPRCFVEHGALTVLAELGPEVELRWVHEPERPRNLTMRPATRSPYRLRWLPKLRTR